MHTLRGKNMWGALNGGSYIKGGGFFLRLLLQLEDKIRWSERIRVYTSYEYVSAVITNE